MPFAVRLGTSEPSALPVPRPNLRTLWATPTARRYALPRRPPEPGDSLGLARSSVAPNPDASVWSAVRFLGADHTILKLNAYVKRFLSVLVAIWLTEATSTSSLPDHNLPQRHRGARLCAPFLQRRVRCGRSRRVRPCDPARRCPRHCQPAQTADLASSAFRPTADRGIRPRPMRGCRGSAPGSHAVSP